MKNKGSDSEDFCYIDTPPEARLSKFERLTLIGGGELDRALAAIAEQFTSVALKTEQVQFELAALLKASQFYSQQKWRANPSTFYVSPAQDVKVHEVLVHGLKDGAIIDLSFPSTYKVQNPEFEEEYRRSGENLVVHARMWKHSSPAPGTLIAIHGWSMGDQRVNSLAFLPGVFYRLGLNVVLIEMPYHGRRAPKGLGVAGDALFPSADLTRTNEAMGQVICDLRLLKRYLEEQGEKHIGVTGMSLGAYVASLWCGLDQLDFCVPIVPFASMTELAWSFLRRMPVFDSMREAGLNSDQLENVYRIHSPLSYPPKLGRDKILIVAGIGDTVIPPRQPKLLWDHWKRPRIVWFGGGHAAQMKRRDAILEVLKFVSGVLNIPPATTA